MQSFFSSFYSPSGKKLLGLRKNFLMRRSSSIPFYAFPAFLERDAKGSILMSDAPLAAAFLCRPKPAARLGVGAGRCLSRMLPSQYFYFTSRAVLFLFDPGGGAHPQFGKPVRIRPTHALGAPSVGTHPGIGHVRPMQGAEGVLPVAQQRQLQRMLPCGSAPSSSA